MVYVLQVFCLLMSLLSVGQTVRPKAGKFSIITFGIFSFLFLIVAIGMLGV